MRVRRIKINPKPKIKYLNLFLEKYWFVPPDVLQRSIEASIWDNCSFKHPILDIGIGNGEVDLLIFKNTKKIDVGIDFEDEGLEVAVQTNKFKKVLKEDASKMSFNNSTFNTVISNSTFEHIKYDVKAISEVSRVLKPGGNFYMTVPNKNLSQWILETEKNYEDKLKEFNARANHLHYRTEQEWEEVFTKNGMDIILKKSYFRKDTAVFWYRIFKYATYKINGKELWSYFASNKFLNLIFKNFYTIILRFFLTNHFKRGYFTSNKGGMYFFVVKKK